MHTIGEIQNLISQFRELIEWEIEYMIAYTTITEIHFHLSEAFVIKTKKQRAFTRPYTYQFDIRSFGF